MNTANTTSPLEQADAMRDVRMRALASLKGDIAIALYDALYSKLQREHTDLLEILGTREREIEADRKANEVLRSDYFLQRKLDVNML